MKRAMDSQHANAEMAALAYLYDHMRDFSCVVSEAHARAARGYCSCNYQLAIAG